MLPKVSPEAERILLVFPTTAVEESILRTTLLFPFVMVIVPNSLFSFTVQPSADLNTV